VHGGRSGEPRTDVAVEPCLLLKWIVCRHERPEPIRTEVAGDDQEIALRNVWQESVLITDGHDSHCR
jgi:hypothetical protein